MGIQSDEKMQRRKTARGEPIMNRYDSKAHAVHHQMNFVFEKIQHTDRLYVEEEDQDDDGTRKCGSRMYTGMGSSKLKERHKLFVSQDELSYAKDRNHGAEGKVSEGNQILKAGAHDE